jgi:sulfur carrier protein
MNVQINGELAEVADGANLDELVSSRVESSRGVAVAVNRDVVPRSAWASTRLAAGDQIEILNATQGG